MVFVLPFETPSKKNSRVVDRRTGRSFPNKRFTDWHKAALLYLRTQGAKRMEGPVHIDFTFTHPTRRRCDSDNKVSSIMDLLVDAGVLPDDCWEVVPAYTVLNVYCKGEAKAEIYINPLPDALE